MKKILIAIFVMACGFAYGQSSMQDDLALIQSYFKIEKKAVVNDFMRLNQTESNAFWPVYNAYEQNRQKLLRERLNNIAGYIGKYGDLNEASAYEIMHSLLINDKKLVKLEKKYLKKMKKAVGGTQATKFFQLETYMRNVVSAKIQENIPAIDQLVK